MKKLERVSIHLVGFEANSYAHFNRVRKEKDAIKESTYYEYLREAVRELNKMTLSLRKEMQIAEIITQHINEMRDHLVRRSPEISSDQYRKMRRAFEIISIAHAGYYEANIFHKFKNPTDPIHRKKKQGRNKRLTTVTPEIYDAVWDELLEDDISRSLMLLAKTTGARPTEMNEIELIDEQFIDPSESIIELKIIGAKKTKKGEEGKWIQRGIDRNIKIRVSPLEKIKILNAIQTVSWLDDREIKNAQERIRRATKRAFPKKKKKMFCLYSLRYTMGSNLKLAYKGKDDADKIVAAILGHKNTSSQSSYGYVQCGVATKVPMVDKDMIKKVKRDKESKYGKRRTRKLQYNN